jgi:hypothetical protein
MLPLGIKRWSGKCRSVIDCAVSDVEAGPTCLRENEQAWHVAALVLCSSARSGCMQKILLWLIASVVALRFGHAETITPDLFVGSSFTSEILRFDGTTGAFEGPFVTAGSGGLDHGRIHLESRWSVSRCWESIYQ